MEAWMHPEEKSLITKNFSHNKVMLEWGSGGEYYRIFTPLKELLFHRA